MSFPIDRPQEVKNEKKQGTSTITTQNKVVPNALQGQSLYRNKTTVFVVTTMYFFFTGICMVFNRKLPKEWWEFGKTLEGGKVRSILEEKIKLNEKEKIIGKVRIVDLDTKKDIYPVS